MPRILAIDYGTKRCGIAVSDPGKMIAGGLETVPSHELMNFLEEYISKEDVECIVFGKPMKSDNTPSDSFVHVERFITAFRKRFPDMKVEWEDERFTSLLSKEAMVAGGMRKSERQKKENIDRISAAIILQSYLNRTGDQI